MNVKEILESVIIDISENKSFSQISSKLQIISRLLNNDNFKSWVEKEFIYGYSQDDELPKERIFLIGEVKADLIRNLGFRVDSYKGVNVPISNLGANKSFKISTIECRDTISVIEKVLSENKGNINYSLTAIEKQDIQDILPDTEILNIYKIVSRQPFQRLVNNSKAKLLDIILELNETVFNNEISFKGMEKKEKVSQIVNNTINTGVYLDNNSRVDFNNSNIIGGKDNEVSLDNKTKQDILELVKKIEKLSDDVECDREDIAYQVANIKQGIENNKSPKLIKSAFYAIRGIATKVLANEITDLIDIILPKLNL